MSATVLGIITARGGSKGIPGKNMKIVAGKPLILWTIEASRRCTGLQRTIVSTDDPEIAQFCREHGVDVPFMRPDRLAQDDSPHMDVIVHALDWMADNQGYRPDYILLLQPTSPLRGAEDIDAAVALAQTANADAVVSVTDTPAHPYLTMSIQDDGTLRSFVETPGGYLRRQSLPPAYAVNGAIYIARRDMLLAERTWYTDRTYAYVMPPERSLDVDTDWDLRLVDSILKDAKRSPAASDGVKVKIGARLIGEGEPCFIIAEAGVNHNGDVELAKSLIDAAKEAGADAVKFQTFTAARLVTESAGKAPYQQLATGTHESQYDMIKKLELADQEFQALSDYARRKDIIFLSSPFDEESVDLLDSLGVPAFKIASGEITNFPLIRYIASRGKPIILSTGMSTLTEVGEALEVIEETAPVDTVLLHCVTAYPAKVEDVNLRAIQTLRDVFGVLVGLSDHTTSVAVPIAAVALGAVAIEKHFTLDRSLPGPDHGASLEPRELRQMVCGIRDAEASMGDGVKRVTTEEEVLSKLVRRSIVARVDIPEGATISRDMLDIKRPGTGLEPKYLLSILGSTTTTLIRQDELIPRSKLKK